MRRVLPVVASTVLAMPCGIAAEDSCPPPAQSQVAIRALLDDWAAAFVRHDAKPLERILADEWLMSLWTEQTRTKADYIRQVQSDEQPHQSITREDERFRFYGCTAVVTYRPIRATGGKRFVFRTTDVFAHQHGRWQLVTRHISEVRPPSN